MHMMDAIILIEFVRQWKQVKKTKTKICGEYFHQ